jgi:hypothetical protein
MNCSAKTFLAIAMGAVALSGSFAINASASEKTVMVGGAPMYPSKNIVENAVHSKDHTTLGDLEAGAVSFSGWLVR